MKQPNDRISEILLFIQPYMEERFQESCRQMQIDIEKNGHAIWRDLQGEMNKLLSYIDKMQKDHMKNKIKYLVCSFSRYSHYLGKLDFYINAQDEGFYLDEQLFDVNEEYIKFYYSVMYKMLGSVSELIMETIEKSGILIADDLKIIYGEYMDKATILYTK